MKLLNKLMNLVMLLLALPGSVTANERDRDVALKQAMGVSERAFEDGRKLLL